jgi:hypothetical protein
MFSMSFDITHMCTSVFVHARVHTCFLRVRACVRACVKPTCKSLVKAVCMAGRYSVAETCDGLGCALLCVVKSMACHVGEGTRRGAGVCGTLEARASRTL